MAAPEVALLGADVTVVDRRGQAPAQIDADAGTGLVGEHGVVVVGQFRAVAADVLQPQLRNAAADADVGMHGLERAAIGLQVVPQVGEGAAGVLAAIAFGRRSGTAEDRFVAVLAIGQFDFRAQAVRERVAAGHAADPAVVVLGGERRGGAEEAAEQLPVVGLTLPVRAALQAQVPAIAGGDGAGQRGEDGSGERAAQSTVIKLHDNSLPFQALGIRVERGATEALLGSGRQRSANRRRHSRGNHDAAGYH